MPYFLGGEIKDRNALSVQTPTSLKNRLDLDVRVKSEVTKIDRKAKSVTVREVGSGKEYQHPYDHLILSLGAMPFKPPIPGIDRPGNLSLRNLEDMDRIGAWITSVSARRAVVCGAGFIGVEMAEQLRHRGMEVALVESLPQIMAPFDPEMAAPLAAELARHGIVVHAGAAIEAFEAPAGGGQGTEVVLRGGRRLPADVVILGLGVRPDTGLARDAGLTLNARGALVVDEYLRTNDPSIWAVGDAIEVRNPILGGNWMVPLAGPANRQGRMAADNIYGMKRKYRGTLGTSVLRCCTLTAACTGINEKGLRAAGVKYQALHLHPRSHASYYPGAQPINLKVLYSPETGKLLGAQAVGADKVEKRIDVMATALAAGMTIDDLAELELCYAPPFGGAKDPVNFAGMVGQNVAGGLVRIATWDRLPALAADPKVVVLDVRTDAEVQGQGKLLLPTSGAPASATVMHIPVDNLRARLGELPRDRTLVVSCLTGQRSYYACRILMQSGFGDVLNLGGAFTTWASYGRAGGAP